MRFSQSFHALTRAGTWRRILARKRKPADAFASGELRVEPQVLPSPVSCRSHSIRAGCAVETRQVPAIVWVDFRMAFCDSIALFAFCCHSIHHCKLRISQLSVRAKKAPHEITHPISSDSTHAEMLVHNVCSGVVAMQLRRLSCERVSADRFVTFWVSLAAVFQPRFRS